jgi:hypothetical protein
MRKRVVFLTPHAGIWAHTLPESFLAKALDDKRFEVSRISCDGTFRTHCTVMEAASVEHTATQAEKDAICRRCVRTAEAVRPSFRGRDFKLGAFLSAADAARAKEMVADLGPDGIEKLEHLGVEVGKIASYETLLKYKKTEWAFSDLEYAHLKTYTLNSLMSLMAFRHLYERIKPDILVSYSPQYGVNGVCARYCELHGTRVYFIEGSANLDERYQALRVWDWTEFGLTNPAMKYWHKVDDYRLTDEELARARRHTNILVSGRSFSVYSEPQSGSFNLRRHFGVPEGSKVVLAAMSSYDEVYSGYVIGRFPANKYYSSVFLTQFDWIRESIPWFAQHPELFFIIRIHPRTFPNKREAIMAPNQKELADLFQHLPPNVRVNYPTDKISIYDLYPQIDVLVTGWSATGIEAMSYGVPVVTYDRNLPSYPASIHYTGDSREQYFANLLLAAQAGRSQSIADNALRWMAFFMSLGTLRHPRRFSDLPFISQRKVLRLGLAVFERLIPGVVKRLEARQAISNAKQINQMLDEGALSLFEVPRQP